VLGPLVPEKLFIKESTGTCHLQPLSFASLPEASAYFWCQHTSGAISRTLLREPHEAYGDNLFTIFDATTSLADFPFMQQ
jgi:hypothetical protein